MSSRVLVGLLLVCAGLAACGGSSPEQVAEEGAEAPAAAEEEEPGLVQIWAREMAEAEGKRYAFDGPGYFPSGWVRLRFINDGEEPHFLLIWDLPDDDPDTPEDEGKTFEDYRREIGQPFEEYYARYRSGELDQAAFFEQLIAAIPDWFYSAVPKGGPGFTSPGQTSETIVYLEPGDNYVLECYVRAAEQDDSFHGTHGMFRPLVVEDRPSGMAEPAEADIEITLSGSDASSLDLAVPGELSAGRHTARVRVTDTPEGFIRHNVHLVKLEGETTAEEVAQWMNWVDAMLAPAPATFLGGAGQMAAGSVSYLEFELEPGRYAWVSEMLGIQGMVHEFTVPE